MKNIFEPTSLGDLSKITKYLLGVTLFFNQTVLLTLKETFFSQKIKMVAVSLSPGKY